MLHNFLPPWLPALRLLSQIFNQSLKPKPQSDLVRSCSKTFSFFFFSFFFWLVLGVSGGFWCSCNVLGVPSQFWVFFAHFWCSQLVLGCSCLVFVCFGCSNRFWMFLVGFRCFLLVLGTPSCFLVFSTGYGFSRLVLVVLGWFWVFSAGFPVRF